MCILPASWQDEEHPTHKSGGILVGEGLDPPLNFCKSDLVARQGCRTLRCPRSKIGIYKEIVENG